MNGFEHECLRCKQLGQQQRQDAFWVMKNEKLYLCRSCSLDMVEGNYHTGRWYIFYHDWVQISKPHLHIRDTIYGNRMLGILHKERQLEKNEASK